MEPDTSGFPAVADFVGYSFFARAKSTVLPDVEDAVAASASTEEAVSEDFADDAAAGIAADDALLAAAALSISLPSAAFLAADFRFSGRERNRQRGCGSRCAPQPPDNGLQQPGRRPAQCRP